ncbi:17500_t:CDS:1, partial [Acaulospora morrowiae]
HGQKIIDGAKVVINTGEAIQVGSELYDVYGKTTDEIERLSTLYHNSHKRRTSYDNACPICR